MSQKKHKFDKRKSKKKGTHLIGKTLQKESPF